MDLVPVGKEEAQDAMKAAAAVKCSTTIIITH
jgi:hypothetical protein